MKISWRARVALVCILLLWKSGIGQTTIPKTEEENYPILPFADSSIFSKYDFYFIGESHPEKYTNRVVLNSFIEECRKEKKITYFFLEIPPTVERAINNYIRSPNDSLEKIFKSLTPQGNLLSLAQMLHENWREDVIEDSLIIVPIETEVVWWLPYEELYALLSTQHFFSPSFDTLLIETQNSYEKKEKIHKEEFAAFIDGLQAEFTLNESLFKKQFSVRDYDFIKKELTVSIQLLSLMATKKKKVEFFAEREKFLIDNFMSAVAALDSGTYKLVAQFGSYHVQKEPTLYQTYHKWFPLVSVLPKKMIDLSRVYAIGYCNSLDKGTLTTTYVKKMKKCDCVQEPTIVETKSVVPSSWSAEMFDYFIMMPTHKR